MLHEEGYVFGGQVANNPEIGIEQFRAIYESSPVGIEIYDAQGGLVELNAACREIFGIDDLSAVKGFRLFEDPNLDEGHKQDLREGRPVQQEVVFDFEKVRELNLYPTSRRGTIHLDLFISPLVSNGGAAVSGYVVHVRDITKRRHAEEMLLDRKRFAENVIDKSAVATFVLDPDHRVLLWNKACENLVGRPEHEHVRSQPPGASTDRMLASASRSPSTCSMTLRQMTVSNPPSARGNEATSVTSVYWASR